MQWLIRFCLLIAAIAMGGASLWAISQNPFARPFVERGAAEARLALDRAMAREITPEWLFPRLEAALAAEDRDEAAMLADLAVKYGVILPAAAWEKIGVLREGPSLGERTYTCAACALDIRSCETIAQIGFCALPFEMTVAGDLNALRRQAGAAIAGEEVDGLEAGLALIGVGATVAVIASGGTSYTVKAGATLLRVARKMGALTPGLARVLREAADLSIDWGALLRRAPMSEITDTAKLARLSRIAENFGAIRANTSTAEALVLFRYVDDAEDAARLAKLSAVAGRETRVALGVLGKARAFRVMTRVADAVIATIGLVAAFLGQIGLFLASALSRALRRWLRTRRGCAGARAGP
jgi:hypothetical protein